MTTKDAIAKAAELFAKWVEGDAFEVRRFPTQDVWFECKPDEVFSWVVDDGEVRIKRRPKKVLRPAWEILREAQAANKVKLYGREVLIVVSKLGFEVALKYIVEAEGADRETINSEWPDEWFTTEDPNR